MQTSNTTDMKDKHGNALKVGDRVVYRKCTEDQDFGTVVERIANYGEILVKWDSNNSNLYCESKDIELIKEITETSSEFTPEDETLLQQLLSKKQKYSTDKEKAAVRYSGMVAFMSALALEGKLDWYIKQNIDNICNILQTYKKYFG